jgi:L-threonylcarbamoyladenylate synthase
MASPGMLERHYSPRAPLTVYETVADLVRDASVAIAAGARVGIMAAEEDRDALALLEQGPRTIVSSLGSERDLGAVASRLYASMRELDALGVDRILARGFPGHEGLAAAIQDRLRRAGVRPGV